MSSAQDRKAEIERKKAKLQAMREEKKRIETEKLKKAAAAKVWIMTRNGAPAQFLIYYWW